MSTICDHALETCPRCDGEGDHTPRTKGLIRKLTEGELRDRADCEVENLRSRLHQKFGGKPFTGPCLWNDYGLGY